MEQRAILIAVANAVAIVGCTEDGPCSGIYYTEPDFNVSSVSVIVDGPGLEPMWWELRVSLWDYPGSEGYPDDEITMHLGQAACPDQRIIIVGHVRRDGTLGAVTYCSYWLDDSCSGAPEARECIPISDGSVTYERSDEQVAISFNNLRILNRLPPEDPPDLDRIVLNGVYRARVTCLETP